MPEYLLVANQTLHSPALWDWITRTVGGTHEPCRFTVVVPATRLPGTTWTEGAARQMASERLARALEHFADLGLAATGQVGDEDPYLAVVDSLSAQHLDAVVVSTLPARVSAWLRLDVVSRLRRHFAIPVVHVAARDTATAAAGSDAATPR